MQNKVFIIAEAGVNHNGSLKFAKELIDLAAFAGADAVKFQAFHAESLVTPSAKKASYQSKNVGDDNLSQYEMLKTLEFSETAFLELKEHSENKGISFLAAPFDKRFVDFLEPIVPFYKIGSGELTNIPFLKYVASKKKAVILSTGMSTLDEVKDAVEVFQNNDADGAFPPLILLHCTTNYPCPFENVNLRVLQTLKDTFNVPVGYSDHTIGYEVTLAAVALGARVIEKHFTLSRSLPGPDHKASLEPHELKEMIRSVRNIEDSFGDGVKHPQSSEIEIAKIARRSLVFSRTIKAGRIISEADITIKRPGSGIPPKFLTEVIGKELKINVEENELVSWEMFR